MINVYYCTNNKAYTQLVISVLSLAKSCKEPVNVINLTVEIPEYVKMGPKTSEEQSALCNKILKQYNPQSSFKTVDVSELMKQHLWGGPNLNSKYYSFFVVVRLLADLVSEIPDKIIYLDADTIICNDLKPLWDIDNSNYEVMGRRDVFRLDKYVQSGVMLLNMKLIRESRSFEKARNYVLNKEMIYIDMTALNLATKSKKIIDKKYNSFKLRKDNVIHHVCATREGKVPFTKKWWHRIKTDEVEMMKLHHPEYIPLYEEFEKIKSENSELF